MRMLAVLAAAVICASGCNTTAPTVPTAAPSDVSSLQALVQQIRSRGAVAVPAETMPRESNPFFSVNARRVVVNGDSMSVFEYPDTAAMNADAVKVHPSGTPIGGTQITWISPPLFYKGAQVIVIYTGQRKEVAAILAAVLGPPFAGVR